MSRDEADPIRRWFSEHEEDDFVLQLPGFAHSALIDQTTVKLVVYTTKRQSLMAIIARAGIPPPFSLVGRYGLPDQSFLDWLSPLVGQRRVVFLGDADPADLLIFAWLRSRIAISFGGVSDQLLERFGVALRPALTIAMTKVESEALRLVREHLPDYAAILGPQCSSLLEAGRKLEIEALISFATVPPAEMVTRLAK